MHWSEARLSGLESDLARLRLRPRSLEYTLTAAELAITKQDDDKGRELLAVAVRDHLASKLRDHSLTGRILTALTALRDFAGAAEFAEDIHALNCSFGTFPTAEGGLPHHSVILWVIRSRSACSFYFSEALFDSSPSDERGNIEVLSRFFGSFDMFARYLQAPEFVSGSVYVNMGDVGDLQGIAGCDYRDGFHLVPDALFCRSRAYEARRRLFRERCIPWEQRIAKVFWRGACTGRQTDDWRSLQRIRLCEILQHQPNQELFDVGVARFTPWMNEVVRAEIHRSGLMRPPVPLEEFGKYKIQIDIPGNGFSISWGGLAHKLCTGSAVMKIPSPLGHTQWYHHRFRPWFNYVPVHPDMSDLRDKASWLVRHDEVARNIGVRGRELIDSLDYDAELRMAAEIVAGAIVNHAYTFGAEPPIVEPKDSD